VNTFFNLFKDAFKPIIEHHFINHTLCGEWCASNKLIDDIGESVNTMVELYTRLGFNVGLLQKRGGWIWMM
jgi:hypothetical protein